MIASQCRIKGKLRDFSTWTLFSHYFVSKGLIGTTIFEIGRVLSESASASGRVTGYNVILWGNSAPSMYVH